MQKDKYIQEELAKLTQSLGSLLLILGASIDLLLSGLDYIVIPEKFSQFFICRMATAGATVVLYVIFRAKKGKVFQSSIIIAATLLTAIMIEIMVLSSGGHASSYYAGMIILLVVVLGFLPISVWMTAVVGLLVYSIYLLPIIVLDNITNMKIFFNNNVFLVASAFSGVAWRYVNQKLLLDKLSLEYDLSQDKEQLKQYSTQLEELVAQRTKELAVSEQKYRGLFDNASDGVAVYDRAGIIINVNEKFCELHGFPVDALIGTNIRVFETGSDDREKEERIQRIADGETLIYEAKHLRRNGDAILLEISAKALYIDGHTYIQAFHRDISDKKRLQEQLFQSQKMDSIGMLAGGLAHDFNNIISAIIGHIELLVEQDNLDANVRKRLAVIESSSRRASKMISRLLRFARKGAIDVQPVELNTVVRDTYDLISNTLSVKNAEVKLELDETIPTLMGDANQIEQVIMNLLVNAGDAIPSGGVVTVKTAAREIGREEASIIHPLLSPGHYVILTVSDTGTGIPEDIRDMIFDPFFTTKEQGKGTGLGLAMVYGIVKEHKGVITVTSQPGKATTFTVYLPASQVDLLSRSAFSDFHGMAVGSVLIIDDHKDMLLFVRETVESLGFTVKSTTNPVIGLQMFKESAPDIALVITDIFMPLIDGRDLVKNIKSIKPSIKVIAMSGYQIEDFVRQDSPVDEFLRKPFGKDELIATVNKLMQPSRSLNA